MKAHKTSIIHKKAKIADSVEIGPYSIIKEHVQIGEGTKIGSHCLIEDFTTIGTNNTIFTGAVIGSIAQDLKFKGEKNFVVIGNNNIIREYVTINRATNLNSKTIVGNNILIMAYSHVAHDCVIRDGAILANAATLAGYVTVEEKAILGGLVGVHQFITIGKHSIIGGCSKVTQDVPPFCMLDGHPARFYGINKIGLKRAGVPDSKTKALEKAARIFFKTGVIRSKAVQEIKKSYGDDKFVKQFLDFIQKSKRGICR